MLWELEESPHSPLCSGKHAMQLRPELAWEGKVWTKELAGKLKSLMKPEPP